MMGHVTLEDLRARLADPRVAVVDVLPRAAYRAKHIPGAINLPLPEVKRRARELWPDLARPIVVYCTGET